MVKITLFGLPGTGTSAVGKKLSEELNLEFISTGNIFRALASKNNYSLNDFSELCKNDSKYDLELDEYIKEFGKTNDNFIIDSRLAWFFIKDSIKIKLICKDETRFKRISERDYLSLEEAKIKTIQREKLENQRYSNLYDIKDYSNDMYFDIIIDTTEIGVGEVIKRIKTYLI